MKIFIVYDSIYGNTEKVAKAIGSAFQADKVIIQAAEKTNSFPTDTELLIIGSPTKGGKHTKSIQDLLEKASLPSNNKIKVAVFDTRMAPKLVGIFGYAANRISYSLKKSGVVLLVPPEGFVVKSAKGPLKEGEIERAVNWGKKLAEKTIQ